VEYALWSQFRLHRPRRRACRAGRRARAGRDGGGHSGRARWGWVGKTALATEYAYRHRFDTVWWIRAQESTTLISDYAGARRLFERALSIREARLGPDHPDTAWSLNDLARTLHTQGDLDRARTLHQRALAIREKRLGPDHPDTPPTGRI
jgi:tetratricopeptide (TPR) repeat protein